MSGIHTRHRGVIGSTSNTTNLFPTTLPSGDIIGEGFTWVQDIADDFNYNYPIGSIVALESGELDPGCAAYTELHDKFTFYPDGWNTTHGDKTYDLNSGEPGYPGTVTVRSKYYPSKTIYFENSALKIFHHSEDISGTVYALGAACKPKNTNGSYKLGPYARWQFRMRSQNVTAAPATSYWHWVPLGIDSSKWPANGELDWPEGDLMKPIAGNYHPAAPQNETWPVVSGESPYDWNVFTVEWTPGRMKWYCNDSLRLNTTDRVPTEAMAFLFQHESDWRQPVGDATVEIDWVSVWKYVPN